MELLVTLSVSLDVLEKRQYRGVFQAELSEFSPSGELLPSKDKVNLSAEYDCEGRLLGCSSGASMRNSPHYYLQVAAIFKLMLDIQGDTIKKHMKTVDLIDAERNAEVSAYHKDEIATNDKRLKELNARRVELKDKHKRSRSDKNKEAYNMEIEAIDKR